MPNRRSLDFLPSIFRTDSNKKFLNATLDQLISEPQFQKINGYVGREFSPTRELTDSYLKEPTPERQHYQLEPSVVYRDPHSKEVEFLATYIDTVNKIAALGGITDNHSRLFGNEHYNFNGLFDMDKFINFSQYYWMADGPGAVDISVNGAPMQAEYNAYYDASLGGYVFTDMGNVKNPRLVFTRGGTYKIHVNQPGNPLWIQTKPSVSGLDPNRPNFSVRDVFGVENNGIDVGTITFTVPGRDVQNQWFDMSTIQSVDYAINIPFSSLHGMPVSRFKAQYGGAFDGVSGSIDGKTVIIVGDESNPLIDAAYWYTQNEIKLNNSPYLLSKIAAYQPLGATVSYDDRLGIWELKVAEDDDGNEIVVLMPTATLKHKQKVFIKSGKSNAATEWYIDGNLMWAKAPLFTASLDELIYQSGSQANGFGVISIVDPSNNTVSVANDIIGQAHYTSPTGIVFTNGLEIKFDDSVEEQYANKTFYVEGVGTGIKLVADDHTIHRFNSNADPDYITISRASEDLNAWSRSNRWFHSEVIKATAKYKNEEFQLDLTKRARRPIIEFNPNLRLFNHGYLGHSIINVLDYTIDSAYTQVNGVMSEDANSVVIETTLGQTLTLSHGDLVVFANDFDSDVANKIFRISLVKAYPDNEVSPYRCTMELVDSSLSDGSSVFAIGTGRHSNTSLDSNTVGNYWYNGSAWVAGQTKTAINQPPLFDVVDSEGVSFGDKSMYINSNFAGTQIFAYKAGSLVDEVLGIPISYKNFNSIGDIEFENVYSNTKFEYIYDSSMVTKNVSSGYLQKVVNGEIQSINLWTKVGAPTKQYQYRRYEFDGTNNIFEIDILPAVSKVTPSVKVYLNNTRVKLGNYTLVKVGVRYGIYVNPSLLSAGDSITVAIYSDAVSQKSYYEIPENLNNNSLNENFTSLTLGQIRNHLLKIVDNSLDVVGEVPGSSNIRDLDVSARTGSIVQHSSPVIYSSLFLLHESFDYINAVKFSQREYTKFKNKFLELATQIDYQGREQLNVADTVDKILLAITANKNNTSPWYYSDMVPYGDAKTVLPEFKIYDTRIRTIDTTFVFNDTVLSNKAVLVYLTRVIDGVRSTRLLVKDRDYSFDGTNSYLTINDSFNLNYDDVIQVIQYRNTDANFIPETPTKLGLYPKFVPEKYLDDTYVSPTFVIQGHDGSLTPAFNDYRDDLLLELEFRIFNNIKSSFDSAVIDYHTLIPGRFRDTEYDFNEFNKILAGTFLQWVGSNKLDYRSNVSFSSNDPKTWNYAQFHDRIDKTALPGGWRAIFKHYYDTDRPHTHPWEMLGFSIKPLWWDERYGAAPYTSGNLVMWNDLAQGYIYAGERKGYHTQYKRVDLLNFVPVDSSGNLKTPESFLVLDFDGAKAGANFAIGQCGPVETAWRRSSEFPFALQIACALAKPAWYFGTLMNPGVYNRYNPTGQFLNSRTAQRIRPMDFEFNGDVAIDGTVVRANGYTNWVVAYMDNSGITNSIDVIKNALKFSTVQLTYKMGGFTDKRYLKVFAEQSSPASVSDAILIPDENYDIVLSKSATVERIVYSGVIIERTANGFTVNGYDVGDPYFLVIPSNPTNSSYTIDVAGKSVVIYNDYQPSKLRVPYGYEFQTEQAVVDFLIGYQRYLNSKGFVFTDMNSDLGVQQDFVLSSREFLAWCAQGWRNGNILVLSPANTRLVVSTPKSIVDAITNKTNGSRLLDPNFKPIKNNNFTVVRVENYFNIQSISGQTIALAVLNLVEYEHVLILDNVTDFNDVIYVPSLGNRQYRIKLIGTKTSGWNGSVYAPGFIYNSSVIESWESGKDYNKGDLVRYKYTNYVALENLYASDSFDLTKWKAIGSDQIKTGLLPNLSNLAQQFETFYDVDALPANSELAAYSNSLIGFRDRDYLTDLAVSPESQVKFYQGYIKQKGSYNALSSLLGAKFTNVETDVSIHEEWAMRVGEYGSTENNSFIDYVVREDDGSKDLITIEFVGDQEKSQPGVTPYRFDRIFKRLNHESTEIFRERTADSITVGDLDTAGYVNLDHVDATILNIKNYSGLISKVPDFYTGYTIWTACDFNGGWNIYRVSETETQVAALEYQTDLVVKVHTETPHGLSVGDVVAIKDFDSKYDGLYQVSNLGNQTEFFIIFYTADLKNARLVNGPGKLFKLSSVRVPTLLQLDAARPAYDWQPGERVWVDNIDGNNNWAVYQKSRPWSSSKTVTPADPVDGGRFGSIAKMDPSGRFLIVSSQGVRGGAVTIHTMRTSGEWAQSMILGPIGNSTQGFGRALEVVKTIIAVGAPESNNSKGYVYLYGVDSTFGITLARIISAPEPTDFEQFGKSIAMSENGHILYIGSPGSNKVYVYSTQIKPSSMDRFEGDGVTRTFTVNYPVTDDLALLVNNGAIMIPNIDYVLFKGEHSTTISFNSPPEPRTEILVRSGTHYKHVGTVVCPDESSTFGSVLKTNSDGTRLYVSASDGTAGGSEHAGKLYVFQREVIEFVGDGNTVSFDCVGAVATTNAGVMVNKSVVMTNQYHVNNNRVVFVDAPAAGSKILVETNTITLVQDIVAPNAVVGGNFGASVDVDSAGQSLIVSAPGYYDIEYAYGAVYRYINTAYTYGEITSDNNDAVITVGHSMLINGKTVVFTGTTAGDVANDINRMEIYNVTATERNGFLTIQTAYSKKVGKLSIGPGIGNSFSNLGFKEYGLFQELRSSENDRGKFGQNVCISRNGDTLLVASKGATSHVEVEFDTDILFDDGTTMFEDRTEGSGSVSVYYLMPNPFDSTGKLGLFSSVQQLESIEVATNTNFGASLDMKNKKVAIGSDFGIGDRNVSSGIVSVFENTTVSNGWDVIENASKKVDLASVNKLSLYDKRTMTLLAFLDVYDPVKGKLLGVVNQDLDYITEFDPAVYNSWDTETESDYHVNYDPEFYWDEKKVGTTWWDYAQCRFIDYEHGSISDRSKNWGKFFPGSTVQIYEWIKSEFHPSVYVSKGGEGYPRNGGEYPCVVKEYTDAITGRTIKEYYFWARSRTTIAAGSKKQNSVLSLEKIITDPKTQGIPYAEILANNSVNLRNISRYLDADHTILHIDYSKDTSENVIHSEYQLLQDAPTPIVPDRILNKMRDSLCGIDMFGNPVPDPSLPESDRLGIGIRPSQSVFKNRFEALENFFKTVNRILSENPVVLTSDLSYLKVSDPYPPSTEYDTVVDTETDLPLINRLLAAVGHRVLVKSDSTLGNNWVVYVMTDAGYTVTQIQGHRTENYWEYIDWFAEGFGKYSSVTYFFNTVNEFKKGSYALGDIIKIKDAGDGRFAIYQIEELDGVRYAAIKALERGTIAISKFIYDPNSGGMGFDNSNFDTVFFDQNPSLETHQLLNAIFNQLFKGSLQQYSNKIFFEMINYILAEQPSVDWIFKTSFIQVLHKMRKLEQLPKYTSDNQLFFESFINEVKPYRTKIREYLPIYQGMDVFYNGVTDFDIPPFWDATEQVFRSPQRLGGLDTTLYGNFPYSEWYKNRTYGVSDIVVENPGLGFIEPPMVTITGGGGSGARAIASIDYLTGKITNIDVVDPGVGYIESPTVEISTVYDPDSLANVQPVIHDGKILNIIVNDSGSHRFTNTPSVEIIGNAQSSGASAIAYLDANGFLKNIGIVSEGIGYTYENTQINIVEPRIEAKAYAKLNNVRYDVVDTQTVLYLDSNVSAHRGAVVSQTGSDGSGILIETVSNAKTIVLDSVTGSFISNHQIIIDDELLTANIQHVSTRDMVSKMGYNTVRSIKSTIRYDRTSYEYSVVEWEPYRAYADNTIVVYNGAPYLAVNANVTSHDAFNSALFKPVEIGALENVNDRVMSFYQPLPGMPPRDLEFLIKGLTFPGVKVDGWKTVPVSDKTSRAISFDHDTMSITSNNTDLLNFVREGYARNQTVRVVGYSGEFKNNATYTVVSVTPSTLKVTGAQMHTADAGTLVNLKTFAKYDEGIYDNRVSSRYLDTTLGTKPEDVNIDAGKYVDQYHSYSPEELVPGIVFDSLNLQVFTQYDDQIIGYREFKGMKDGVDFYRINNFSPTLAADLHAADTVIRVSNASLLPSPSPIQNVPGVVFINGEKIYYWSKDDSLNTLGQLRRAVDGTGAPAIHITGSKIYDASALQLVSNTYIDTTTVDQPMGFYQPLVPTMKLTLDRGVSIVGNVLSQGSAVAKILESTQGSRFLAIEPVTGTFVLNDPEYSLSVDGIPIGQFPVGIEQLGSIGMDSNVTISIGQTVRKFQSILDMNGDQVARQLSDSVNERAVFIRSRTV